MKQNIVKRKHMQKEEEKKEKEQPTLLEWVVPLVYKWEC